MIYKMILFEINSIFKSKKFFFALLFQFILILTIIPLFDAYIESLERKEVTSLTPGTYGFVPVAVVSSNLNFEREKVFRIFRVSKDKAFDLLNKKIVCAVVLENEIILDEENPKSEVAKFYISKLIDEATPFNLEVKTKEKILARPDVRDEARIEIKKTYEIVRRERTSYTTLLILLLPIFILSGLLLDTIVSEKENRTGEILFSLPTRKRNILVSKISSIFLISVLQIFLWVFILYLMERISSLVVFLPLTLTSLLLISVSSFISVYSKNYKEAGFLVTITYVLLFTFMFSATALYPVAKRISSFSPLTLVLTLEKESLEISELLTSSLPTLIFSFLLIFLTLKLFERDDFYFGPKPSIFSLSLEFLNKLGKSPYSVAFFTGALMVFVAPIFEFGFGIVISYVLEFKAIYPLIFLFAFIEEILKAFGIFAARKYSLKFKDYIICGALSGLGFALIENAIFGVLIVKFFPQEMLVLFLIRSFSGTLIHVSSSVVSAIGISKDKYFFIVLASLIHAFYNLVVVTWG